jgi:hypothetical protein
MRAVRFRRTIVALVGAMFGTLALAALVTGLYDEAAVSAAFGVVAAAAIWPWGGGPHGR